MRSPSPAPNRPLDLEELDRPEFRAVLRELDELVTRDDISYLPPGKRWEYPWALERARLPAGSRILDVGSRDSIFPVYLASLGHDVTAADLGFTANLARLHDVDARYVRADMTALPLQSETFDAVFCISVIEHLPDDRIPIALAELRRVLRPGARLYLTTDYYEDAGADLWYSGPDLAPFPVDWGVFDEQRCRELILSPDRSGGMRPARFPPLSTRSSTAARSSHGT